MKKKKFLQDENALSEVLGFVLIMGIVLSTTTIYLSIQTPEWTKDYESRHADGVADDFSEQDSLIDGIVLIAKQGGDIAAGTTPIKMAADKVPIFGMTPPGSRLNSLPDDESFVITPYVGTLPLPATVYNFSWVESTTDDFMNATATRVNVDVTSNEIKLSRLTTDEDLPLDNNYTILGGEYYYDQVVITNNSILYVAPGQFLKIYANNITVDATSQIFADGRGFLGGDGGKIGSGAGYGNPGDYGAGGGGAGYGNESGLGGGDGGNSSDPSTSIGAGGEDYGDKTSSSIEFGSGGGGGGYGTGHFTGASGGVGGTGGGALLLDAEMITIEGTIPADGSYGISGFDSQVGQAGGGGGGGSGGAILIRGRDVSISGTLSAKGGLGGSGGSSNTLDGGGGAGGAGGRIKIFYENASLYTATAPSYSVDGGTRGAGGSGKDNGFPGENGSLGSFYDNETTYISAVPHSSSGFYVSRVYDTRNTTTCYGNMTWNAYSDEYTPIVMKVRTWMTEYMKENATLWENCDAVANGQDISELNSAFDGHRYVQYCAELSTYDATMTPILYEVRINYSSSNPAGGVPVVAESSGIIKFNSHYLYYPNQEIVYEHGAVIKCQSKGEGKVGFMLHSPPIDFANESGTPTIRISMIDLTGSDHSYSGSTTTSVENSYTDYKSFSSTFDNLTLNLTTEYPYIWGKWFNKTLEEETNLTTPYHYNVSVNATTRTVAVEFYGHVDEHGHGPGVQLYLEKTAVEVKI